MKLEFIESLVEIAERARVSEFEYREGENRVQFRLAGAAVESTCVQEVRSAPPVSEISVATVVEPSANKTEGHSIKSPLVGVFYRAPSPDKPPFASVGDRVEEGQTLAIVEAMKMLNQIEADRAGRIVAILPADGEAVEFGDLLFVIELEA